MGKGGADITATFVPFSTGNEESVLELGEIHDLDLA